MALSRIDLKKIRDIFKEESANLVTKEEFDVRIANLATKEELDERIANLATKEDLKNYVTKDDFKEWEDGFWERFASIFGQLVTKEEFYVLKSDVDEMKNHLIVIQDGVLAINNKLDTEYTVVQERGVENTRRIEKLERFAGFREGK